MKSGLMINSTVKEIVCTINDFKLCRENNHYFIIFPDNTTMVNASGSKQDIINEMERWKKEIDSNNPFMLEVENGFIKALSAGK
jgi:hypothetical protein